MQVGAWDVISNTSLFPFAMYVHVTCSNKVMSMGAHSHASLSCTVSLKVTSCASEFLVGGEAT